jgi:hypothetical protein
MPKQTPPDLDLLDHLTPAAYWDLWDRYASVALQSILTFHGACDGAAPTTAAQMAADSATELLNQRMERMEAIMVAREAAREEENAANKRPKR